MRKRLYRKSKLNEQKTKKRIKNIEQIYKKETQIKKSHIPR